MKKVHQELEEEEDMGKYIFKSTLIFIIFFSSYIIFLYFYYIIFFSRGPNKYTRNWEDEDAYGKPGSNILNRNRRFNRSGEDFPALGTNKNASTHVEEPVISSAWYSSKNKSQNKVPNFPPLQTQNDSSKTKSSHTSTTHTYVIILFKLYLLHFFIY